MLDDVGHNRLTCRFNISLPVQFVCTHTDHFYCVGRSYRQSMQESMCLFVWFCVTVEDLVNSFASPLGMALTAMAAAKLVANNGECDFYL